MRGIWVSPEMKELYRCLKAANIDVYVCSASLELIVEALACDPVLGFGLPADRVYGLRFVDGEKIIAKFDPQYKQPIKEGKVDCIKAYMAPAYGNKGPVLIAGDSNGDVPMLTAFPDMKHGLIIDVGRSETSAIGQPCHSSKEGGQHWTLYPPTIVRSYKILRKKVMIPVLIKSANIAPMMGTMRKGLTV